MAGHSLFTGTLVEGFNWGRADLDGNGLVTASELGLYLQQQVGQAAQKRDVYHGTYTASEPGAITKKIADPMIATARRMTSV